MTIPTQETELPKNSTATDLGTFFYPTHCLWVAFPKADDAKTVYHELMSRGYSENHCNIFESNEVIARATRDLEENVGFIERLGWSFDAVEIHLEAARQGATFLLVHEPADSEVEKVMEVIRCVPFTFVHHYTPLTIEILS